MTCPNCDIATCERDRLKAEVARLREANEHWHTRVSHHATDMDAALAERDRLKALCDELRAALRDAADELEEWLEGDPAERGMTRLVNDVAGKARAKAKESAQ